MLPSRRFGPSRSFRHREHKKGAQAILLVLLAFTLLGDWLRDTLDPELRQL
jgi:hypothetical protein